MGLILIIIVIGVVVWLIVQSRNSQGIFTTGTCRDVITKDTPLEILKKRYARGEIDRAEFEDRKNALV